MKDTLQISIPETNNTLNKIFNTKETAKDPSAFHHFTLRQVIERLYGKALPYEINIVSEYNSNGEKAKTQRGQYLTIDDGESLNYVVFSNPFLRKGKKKDLSTRNGYITAKLPVGFRKWYSDVSLGRKASFNVCLLDVDPELADSDVFPDGEVNLNEISSSAAINPYSIFSYRLLKTCNIKILNEDALPFKKFCNEKRKGKYVYRKAAEEVKHAFKSVAEVASARNALQQNANSKGSYILDFDDSVFIYGKTFGNNGFEMILITYVISLLAKKEDKEVIFYQVKNRETKHSKLKPINKDNLELLTKMCSKVYDELIDYSPNPEAFISNDKNSRSQAAFMKNMMEKYGLSHKRCFLCDCDIQELIIASHIQRVVDINNLNIEFDEKRRMATDGDNGFWLCANHDKMFECGDISFDENDGELFFADDLSKNQIDFIEKSLQKTKIDEDLLTNPMKDYLAFHNKRLFKDSSDKFRKRERAAGRSQTSSSSSSSAR